MKWNPKSIESIFLPSPTPVARKLSSADWTPEYSEAFRKLKQVLLDNAILAHPNFSKPFLLSVDASSNGLGAVLSQLAEGTDNALPIAFTSKSLNYALSCYPAHRLEFLVLKWAVCDKFSHWLRAHPFTIWTDNNPLTHILTKPKPDVCEQRWVSKLAPYNFDIKYIPGPRMLWRIPSAVSHLCSQACFIASRKFPMAHSWRKQMPWTLTVYRTYQYVVPSAVKQHVLKGVHDEAGHQGQRRTLYLARQRFYWHGMDGDIKDYVQRYCPCVFSKSPEPEARAPLGSVKSSRPLELVCIDFWSAEDTSNKSLDVLVVTDHFTKLAQAYLCPNQSAKAVDQQLWNSFFCVYGFPERVHSDQGANFESSLIAEMLQIVGVEKSQTTPYHPMGNGAVERFNRTL